MNEASKIKRSSLNKDDKKTDHSDSCDCSECSEITQTDSDMDTIINAPLIRCAKNEQNQITMI